MDLKDAGSTLRLKKSCVFFYADFLTLMGWGRVVLVLAYYCTQRMVDNTFFPAQWDELLTLLNVELLPHLVGFVHAIKVKRAEESGG